MPCEGEIGIRNNGIAIGTRILREAHSGLNYSYPDILKRNKTMRIVLLRVLLLINLRSRWKINRKRGGG